MVTCDNLKIQGPDPQSPPNCCLFITSFFSVTKENCLETTLIGYILTYMLEGFGNLDPEYIS